MAHNKKVLAPLPPFAPPLFALNELADWRERRIRAALPRKLMRAIVLRLFTRGNFRQYSERYVAELATVYSQWLMQVVFHAHQSYGANWRIQLLRMIEGEFALA